MSFSDSPWMPTLAGSRRQLLDSGLILNPGAEAAATATPASTPPAAGSVTAGGTLIVPGGEPGCGTGDALRRAEKIVTGLADQIDDLTMRIKQREH